MALLHIRSMGLFLEINLQQLGIAKLENIKILRKSEQGSLGRDGLKD